MFLYPHRDLNSENSDSKSDASAYSAMGAYVERGEGFEPPYCGLQTQT